MAPADHAGHGVHAGHAGGHDKHAGHSVEMFRSKFWVSLALTIPIIALGHMVPRALGIEPLHFPGSAKDLGDAVIDGVQQVPGAEYLVFGVLRGRVTEAKLFRWTGGDFVETLLPLRSSRSTP